MIHKSAPLIISLSLLAGSAQASLIDRGGGLIYDDVLDITWQQTVNLASTQTFGVTGISSNGAMSWSTAHNWISAMNSANYLGYNDWRLPTTTPVNGFYFDFELTYDGLSDHGYNIIFGDNGISSEMGWMYYINLNNKALCDFFGNCPQPGWSPTPNVTFTDGETGLTKSFTVNNLDGETIFWTGVGNDDDASAWAFRFNTGNQHARVTSEDSLWYAMAVRDGDVAPVPLPSTAWVFLSGLIGLLGLNRRQTITFDKQERRGA